MKTKPVNKILSLLLALVMVAGMLPLSVLTASAAVYLDRAGLSMVKLPAVGKKASNDFSPNNSAVYTWKNMPYHDGLMWLETYYPITDIKAYATAHKDSYNNTYYTFDNLFDGTFKEGRYYTAIVCLRAKTEDGYYWATDKSEITATINGSSANVTDVFARVDAEYRNVIGIWKCYGPLTYGSQSTVGLNRVEINDVKIPSVGEKASDNRTLPSDATYKTANISFDYTTTNYNPIYHFMWVESDTPITSLKPFIRNEIVGWNGSIFKPKTIQSNVVSSHYAFNGTFKEGKYYACVINIVPTDGRTWTSSDDITATINGMPANISVDNLNASYNYYDAGQGMATIWKSFGPLKSITTFEANVTAPKCDAVADFTATLPENCGYSCAGVVWIESTDIPKDTYDAFLMLAKGEASTLYHGDKFKSGKHYTAVAYLVPQTEKGYCVAKGSTPAGLLSGYSETPETTLVPDKVLLGHTFTGISSLGAKWNGNKATWTGKGYDAKYAKIELFKDNKLLNTSYANYSDSQFDFSFLLSHHGAGNYYFRVTPRMEYVGGAISDLPISGQSETAYIDAKVLSGIAVTTPPDKLSYKTNEAFSKTGMVVTATFSDGTKNIITGYELSDNAAVLQAGQQTITISYTYKGVTKTATQTVTASASNYVYYINISDVKPPVTDENASFNWSVDSSGGVKKYQNNCVWYETSSKPSSTSVLKALSSEYVYSGDKPLVFKADKFYTCLCLVDKALDTNYAFADGVKAQVNGTGNIAAITDGDGCLMIWYFFGYPTQKISSVELLNVRPPYMDETPSFDFNLPQAANYKKIDGESYTSWFETDDFPKDFGDLLGGTEYHSTDSFSFKADKHYTFATYITAKDGYALSEDFTKAKVNKNDAHITKRGNSFVVWDYLGQPSNGEVDVYVGGVQMKHGYYIPGGTELTDEALTDTKPTSGGYAYMKDERTLVLHDFVYEANESQLEACKKAAIYSRYISELQIEVEGTSSINVASGVGIYTEYGNTVITGNGADASVLNLNTEESISSFNSICVKIGSCSISDCSVNFKGSMEFDVNFTADNAILTLVDGTDYIEIKGNAVLNNTVLSMETEENYGIGANGSMTVTGCDINVGSDYGGGFSASELTIKDTVLSVLQGMEASDAISAYGNLTIENSEITTEAKSGSGISTYNGNIVIKDSIVNTAGGTRYDDYLTCSGIHSEYGDEITITGSTVTAPDICGNIELGDDAVLTVTDSTVSVGSFSIESTTEVVIKDSTVTLAKGIYYNIGTIKKPDLSGFTTPYEIFTGADAESATKVEPSSAWHEGKYKYIHIVALPEITIGGVQMRTGCFLPCGTNLTEDDLTHTQPVSGGFAYMPNGKTLILSDYKFEGKNGTVAKAIENNIDGLEIRVVGDNILEAANYGIYSADANISIIGDGTSSSKITVGASIVGRTVYSGYKKTVLFKNCSVISSLAYMGNANNGATLTFDSCDVVADGIAFSTVNITNCLLSSTGTEEGILANNINITDSNVNVSGCYESAMIGFIKITNSTVVAESRDGYAFDSAPDLSGFGYAYTIVAGNDEESATDASSNPDYWAKKYVKIDSENIDTAEYFIEVSSGKATDISGSTVLKALPGTMIIVTAAAPAEGKVFDYWAGDAKDLNMEDINASTTGFIMPEKNVSVWATYKALPPSKYAITVTSGTASPTTATKGTKVTITANAAPAGKVFDKWVVKAGGVTLANANADTTTFKMGDANVEVEALYKAVPAQTYGITVTNGTSTKAKAAKGEMVTITANAPSKGYAFDKWVVKAGGVTLANANADTTTFKMGDKAVSIEATYKFVAYGNVDGEGEGEKAITAADARLCLRAAVGLEVYAEGSYEYLACDVDGEPKITASDARLVLRRAVGLDKSFPVEEN